MELVEGFTRNEGENEAEAKNSKNTAYTHHTQQEVEDSFAHTGDQTGPTQPHGEFGARRNLSPEGGSSS